MLVLQWALSYIQQKSTIWTVIFELPKIDSLKLKTYNREIINTLLFRGWTEVDLQLFIEVI